MGVDTAELWSFPSCSTLVFAATARQGWLCADVWLFGTGTIEESMLQELKQLQFVREVTGMALTTGGLVKVTADQGGVVGLSAGILVRAVILTVGVD